MQSARNYEVLPDIPRAQWARSQSMVEPEPTITKQAYRIVLQSDEDGRIVARCLDLEGVVTDGATEDEAIKNAYEAMEAMLEARGMNKEFNLIVVENTSA